DGRPAPLHAAQGRGGAEQQVRAEQADGCAAVRRPPRGAHRPRRQGRAGRRPRQQPHQQRRPQRGRPGGQRQQRRRQWWRLRGQQAHQGPRPPAGVVGPAGGRRGGPAGPPKRRVHQQVLHSPRQRPDHAGAARRGVRR
ncbi:unnamed protein product, partial [Prorocentrum cordatum]